MIRKAFLACIVLAIFFGVGVGIFAYRAKTIRSDSPGERVFHIDSGESISSLARRLEDEQRISSRWYFLWSAYWGGLKGRIQAGDFVIPGRLTSPEVVALLRLETGKPSEISLTFPEGWTAEKMADRLRANRFDGERFLELVHSPLQTWREEFPFFATCPEEASLEGFLFPDTYSFRLDASPEAIIRVMLRNFGVKFDGTLRSDAKSQNRSIYEVVTLASILEKEIGTTNQSQETIDHDRKIASGIFLHRLSDGHRLESDATVAYARGETKIQHSLEDIDVNSPYNTYRNKGLPPGPISNPGLSALQAALHPISSDFYFFLNNPQTGETFFARTFEDHLLNKEKNGL